MRWAPQGLHRRVADPVPTPQRRHGTGDFRPKRNCWRWVWQYSYTQRLPQISRELTLSQGQILIALIVAYDKSILPSKWKIPWIFSVREYCNYPWGVCRARWRVWCVVRRGGGCWGPRRGCWAGWCGVPWGWVLGAAEGVLGGGGVGCRGGGCWEPRRGCWAGWCGVPWGWVLGAVLGAVEGVVWGAVGVGAGSRGGGTGRGGVGCRGGGCWEPWRGYWAGWWGCRGGRALGAAEGVLGVVVWGAVGAGAGSRGGGGREAPVGEYKHP